MTLPPGARHGAGEHLIEWDAPETEAGVDINVESLEGSGDCGARAHCRFALPRTNSTADLRPCVRAYRDRSIEKDPRFPVKLSKSGPDTSECIVTYSVHLFLEAASRQCGRNPRWRWTLRAARAG